MIENPRPLQLGDIVIAYSNPAMIEKWGDTNYGEIYINEKRGRVIHINVTSGTEQNTMVEFQKSFIGGHNGKIGDVGGKKGHCWCCSDKYLKLVE